MHRGLSRHNNRSAGGAAFSPLSLFADGSQGAWYDNSNMSTLFQDSAGTTPAVLESPVGKQLDLSGRGNHRSQATSANRPLLSARYNLLTKTEQFDNAAWGKVGATVTANATTAPDNTNTANLLTEDSTNNVHVITQTQNASASVSYTTIAYFKRATGTRNAYIQVNNNTTGVGGASFAWFDLSSGVASAVSDLVAGFTSKSASMVLVANNFYKCTLVLTTVPATTTLGINYGIYNAARSYLGDGTSGIYAWGADCRPTDQTVTLPAYQRVDTSTVYDTVGFPQYLKYNGSTQSLSTASVDFTATAQMSVFAGVRKLSTSVGVVVELSAIYSSYNGTFYIAAPNSSLDFGAGSKGTIAAGSGTVAFNPPTTKTLQMLSDIPAPLLAMYVNNSSVFSLNSTQGSGNYGNYPLYFGMRGGASFPFNGQEYQMIIVGKTLTAAQITSTETFVNNRTKAY